MMEKKKIIFLDIDGVLNYTQWYISDRNPGNLFGQEGEIDPECVKRIVDICNITGARIVISSDWRVSWPGCRIRLENAGFPRGFIIDKTPEHMMRMLTRRDYMLMDDDEIEGCSRGGEIKEWVDTHEDTYDYVIIDDRIDFTDEQKRLHFVHVDSNVGFTDDDKAKALDILSR